MIASVRGVLAVSVVGALVAVAACSRPAEQQPEAPLVANAPPDEASPVPAPPEDLKALADGNNQFALDLYRRLADATDGNVTFSPYSISSALAMTYAGARGQTAEEMRKVLHFTLPDDRLHPAFGTLMRQLQDTPEKTAAPKESLTPLQEMFARKDPFRLTVANALWGQQGSPFLDDFLSTGRVHYHAALRELDFGRPEEARQTINRWVAEKTQDKIKELLKPNDIHPNIRLVLTNAIYFKAAWWEQFPKEATEDAPFEVSPDEKIIVKMMQTRGSFRYLKTDNCEWLELPYQGERISMIVLLPRKGQLPAVEGG